MWARLTPGPFPTSSLDGLIQAPFATSELSRVNERTLRGANEGSEAFSEVYFVMLGVFCLIFTSRTYKKQCPKSAESRGPKRVDCD